MYVRPHTINTHIFVCHIFQIMSSDSTQPGSEGSQKDKEYERTSETDETAYFEKVSVDILVF